MPVQEEQLPALRIYTTGETSNMFDASQKRYERMLALSVECYAQGDNDDDLDQRLEELGDAVEAAMHIDETFGNVASDVEYVGCDYQLEPVATAPLGVMIQRYSIKFYSYAQRLEGGCLDAFKGADIEWAVGHNAEPTDNIVDAVDKVDVPLI